MYRRMLLVAVMTIAAALYTLPNIMPNNKWLPQAKINLGLDLAGGAHLLLAADFDSYLSDQFEIVASSLKKELRSQGLGYRNIKASSRGITFQIREGDSKSAVEKVIRGLDYSLVLREEAGIFSICYDDAKLRSLREEVIAQSIEVVRMRVDTQGTKEPVIQKQGDNNILLQVPGIDNPASLKNLLGQTAKLTFNLLADNSNGRGKTKVVSEKRGDQEYKISVENTPVLTGDLLDSVKVTYDSYSRPAIAFSFNAIGTKLFAAATGQNAGKQLAIVLDDRLLSAPVINEPILGGAGIISGNFTVESANELAVLLRAGALPAPLKVIEERNVGPNLGLDSIAAGKKAGFVGLMGVIFFMVLIYGRLGLIASLTLNLTLLYMFALLSALGATLTLPGIAGIILTIGMAVDANILIYERIREELRQGVSIPFAVQQGFKEAFSTIADSNITTLFAASILYTFGVGAIRGFAVTLTLGIIASMFAAIIGTKLFLDIWLRVGKPTNIGLS